MTLWNLVLSVADAVKEAAEPVALLFEDVDLVSPLAPSDISYFSLLASRMEGPVIITSREGATDWTALPSGSVVQLESFTLSDVRDCLLMSPELRGRSVQELEEGIALVQAGHREGQLIQPAQTFIRLAAWSHP
jgi:hypothetical protein